MTRDKALAIVNGFGNVDVRERLSKRYVHVRGKRLQPLCRKLGIRYAQALVGFKSRRRYGYEPQFDGVVVSARSAPKLSAEIEAREKRNSPEKRKKAAERRAKLKEGKDDRLWALGIDPASRTARWLRRHEISEAEAQLISFKVMYRHEHTDYDELLPTEGRDARWFLTEHAIPKKWDDYLDTYDFPHTEIAESLAKVLKSPTQAHPVWFCEAVLAVKRANLALDTLCYEAIRDAINDWRARREMDRD